MIWLCHLVNSQQVFKHKVQMLLQRELYGFRNQCFVEDLNEVLILLSASAVLGFGLIVDDLAHVVS